MDVEHKVPIRLFEVPDRRVARQAGIVDQDVDRPERRQRLLHGPLDLRCAAHIGAQGDSAAAERLDGGHGFSRGGGIYVENGHIGPLFRVPDGCGTPDPRPGPRHERYPTGQQRSHPSHPSQQRARAATIFNRVCRDPIG